MAIHVAILIRPYLDMILRGRKTIESRLLATAAPPCRCVTPGDRLFLKVSAGPFMATALADRVEEYDNLNVARVRELYRQYNGEVCGTTEYWKLKKNSRYAVFIRLRDVEPFDVGPAYDKNNWKAWFVLDDAASPLREVSLTAGAIRNRYVRPPMTWNGFFPDGPFDLELPDGRSVTTDINERQLIRWRGWGRYYADHGARPGDRVRFVRLGPRRYRVGLLPAPVMDEPA